MTNFERIKQMTVDEIANKILYCISSDPCDYCQHKEFAYCNRCHCRHLGDEEIIKEWLESEFVENAET